MANKKPKPERSKEVKPELKATPKKVATNWYNDKLQLGIMAAILLVTFIVYSPALSSTKEFTNWDDPVYVVEQPLITGLYAEHIKGIFTEPVSLNYHPLTMLSLAINYHFSELHPFGYFLTNIVLHLLNTFLVFLFLYRLSNRKFWVGAIAALLFGVHPMHVESVAWVSERKDVLYCFFFLTSCITYLNYLETKKIAQVVLCFVLFICSCLSKAMAAPLPLVLLLIDFYRQRKFTVAVIVEKIPFFAITLLAGLYAVKIQSQGAIADMKVFTIPQRFMFASFGFVMYLVKMVAPVLLSTFYPYPNLNKSGGFDWWYPASVALAAVLVLAPAYLLYKKDKSKFRLFVFGVGFFIVMLAMVLQFVSVGKAIMADRYTYVSYIGIFFLIASLIEPLINNARTKTVVLAAVLVVSSVFAVMSYARVQIWDNSGVLWTNVIQQFPYEMEQNGNVITVTKVGVDDAYKNRGNYYREHGDVQRAMADYETLVRVQSKDEDAYSGMGNFYAMQGNLEKSLEMYSKSLEMRPGKLDTYRNRSITYSRSGKHKEALEDLLAAIKYNPSAAQLLLPNIAYEELAAGMYNEAVTDCNKLLTVNPNDADALLYRGTAYINLSKYEDGIIDLNKARGFHPNSGDILFNLSFAYNRLGKKPEAIKYAEMAQKNGYKVSDQYLQQLNSK